MDQKLRRAVRCRYPARINRGAPDQGGQPSPFPEMLASSVAAHRLLRSVLLLCCALPVASVFSVESPHTSREASGLQRETPRTPPPEVRQSPPLRTSGSDGLPDLAISAGYTLESCAIEGMYSRVRVVAKVSNVGKKPAMVGGWGIPVTANPTVALDIPKAYTVKQVAHGPNQLAPGASFTVELLIPIGPAQTNKGYQVVAVVDPENHVAEESEDNNSVAAVDVPAAKKFCTAK
ncbi:MAG: hypothetical protein L6Q60_00730 [Rhodocyclaceae bacterium]|nr:hypothetical protein [Rhodocyclaceae bacterium]